MSFFHQIHNLGDDADLTLVFIRKDDKLTIEVKPGAGTTLAPKVITGTPTELADGFLLAILAKPEPQPGLAVQDMPTETSPKKPAPAAKEKHAPVKNEKSAKPQKPAKVKPERTVKPAKASKAAAPQEVSMFDQPTTDNQPGAVEVETEEDMTGQGGSTIFGAPVKTY